MGNEISTGVSSSEGTEGQHYANSNNISSNNKNRLLGVEDEERSDAGSSVPESIRTHNSPPRTPERTAADASIQLKEEYTTGCDVPPSKVEGEHEKWESVYVGTFGGGSSDDDDDCESSCPLSQEKTDVTRISTHALSQHHLFLGAMCMAYARRREEFGGATEDILSTDLELLDDDTIGPLAFRPYPPDIWRTWSSWKGAASKKSPLLAEVTIHSIFQDALNDFVYAICVAPQLNMVTVVLGATTDYRLGQGVHDYDYDDSTKFGVDGCWAAGILGHDALLETILQEVQELDCRCLSFVGYSGGAALATICSVWISNKLSLSAPISLYTFGCPKVGDARFARLHDRLVQENKLRHLRFYNVADVITRRPILSWEGIYRAVGIPISVSRRHTLDLEGYWQFLHKEWQADEALEEWYAIMLTRLEEDYRRRTVKIRMVICFLVVLLIYAPLVGLAIVQYIQTHHGSSMENLTLSTRSMHNTLPIKLDLDPVDAIEKASHVKADASSSNGQVYLERKEAIKMALPETAIIEDDPNLLDDNVINEGEAEGTHATVHVEGVAQGNGSEQVETAAQKIVPSIPENEDGHVDEANVAASEENETPNGVDDEPETQLLAVQPPREDVTNNESQYLEHSIEDVTAKLPYKEIEGHNETAMDNDNELNENPMPSHVNGAEMLTLATQWPVDEVVATDAYREDAIEVDEIVDEGLQDESGVRVDLEKGNVDEISLDATEEEEEDETERDMTSERKVVNEEENRQMVDIIRVDEVVVEGNKGESDRGESGDYQNKVTSVEESATEELIGINHDEEEKKEADKKEADVRDVTEKKVVGEEVEQMVKTDGDEELVREPPENEDYDDKLEEPIRCLQDHVDVEAEIVSVLHLMNQDGEAEIEPSVEIQGYESATGIMEIQQVLSEEAKQMILEQDISSRVDDVETDGRELKIEGGIQREESGSREDIVPNASIDIDEESTESEEMDVAASESVDENGRDVFRQEDCETPIEPLPLGVEGDDFGEKSIDTLPPLDELEPERPSTNSREAIENREPMNGVDSIHAAVDPATMQPVDPPTLVPFEEKAVDAVHDDKNSKPKSPIDLSLYDRPFGFYAAKTFKRRPSFVESTYLKWGCVLVKKVSEHQDVEQVFEHWEMKEWHDRHFAVDNKMAAKAIVDNAFARYGISIDDL